MSRCAVLIVLLLNLLSFLVLASSILPVTEHEPKANGLLQLLVVGDWGRKGEYNQSQVAVQMGRIGKELGVDFVISTGDNFYEDGLTGINDPAFEESFSQIYTAEALQTPWYSVLGNHDYRGDALAQLDPALNRIDHRWICMRSFVLNTGIADFFMVDTNPFVDDYWAVPNKHTYDWRGVIPRQLYIKTLLKDLDTALKQSPAKWKIVVGHHTIRSVGHHGDTVELQNLLLPVLESNGVDLYINGHDHCLEHISSTHSRIQFLTSGGGSKAWRGIDNAANMEGLKFYYDGQGFMSLGLTETEAGVAFYDINGDQLHTWTASKPVYSSQ
ncbi:Purple acid phosphatase 3 [Nymphaea thermarum]|nr:Purple acid phosphatase 3 [Nymphaea thermarum]